jgi:hypothetical protein
VPLMPASVPPVDTATYTVPRPGSPWASTRR